VKKLDVEIGPISRRPARVSDDHPSKPKPGLPGTPTDAAKTPQQRSFGFAQDLACGLRRPQDGSTLQKRGSFRNSARCLDYTRVKCLRITLRIAFRSANFRSLTPAKRLNTRSFDFAQDFGSRLGRRENASALQKTGLIPSFRPGH
jgi:hypothetical protein